MNIIPMHKVKGHDPILRKGDLVTIVDDDDMHDLSGIVVEVATRLGPDTPAPGQAALISVAIPYEEGWEIFKSVHIEDVRRTIGPDSYDLRGWEV